MADPTESALTTAAADALSGTTDTGTGVTYCTIADSSYYTEDYQKEAIWNRILATPNELRVVKDGTVTFGVFSGTFIDGATARTYAGAAEQALTDDDTNYVYLTAAGVLTVNVTGFPTGENHVPLATIAVGSESAAGVSGAFAHADITDYRGRALFSASGGRGAVESVTVGVGTPNVLTANESGKALSNEGATAQVYHTLPTAAAGLTFTFVVQDSDGVRIVANTGDTIRVQGDVSPAAGYIESTTVGEAVTLIAVNATEWIATSEVGAWTVSA